MQDLSTLPEVLAAGWTELGGANAINDAGQIVGSGVINRQQHAFLLTPGGPSPKTAGPCPSSGQGTGDPNKPDPCPLGNPINPFIGNKYQIETDYVGAGTYPLRVERYYNSIAGSGSGHIGAKWRHTFDRSISVSGAQATVFRPDGKQFVFPQSGADWVAPADVMDRLTQSANGWIYTTARLDQAVDSVRARADTTFLYLSNRGQMVLPVMLELRYADGSTETRSLPVEMWNLGMRFTYRLATAKRLTSAVIDPRRIYPDIVRDNNTWKR